jgi:hypothetical protein
MKAEISFQTLKLLHEVTQYHVSEHSNLNKHDYFSHENNFLS